MDLRATNIHIFGESKWSDIDAFWNNSGGYQGYTPDVIKTILSSQGSLRQETQLSSTLKSI